MLSLLSLFTSSSVSSTLLAQSVGTNLAEGGRREGEERGGKSREGEWERGRDKDGKGEGKVKAN